MARIPGDWTWWGGDGHASANYAGVYSRIDYWGGADDYLVSPRLDVEAGRFYLSGLKVALMQIQAIVIPWMFGSVAKDQRWVMKLMKQEQGRYRFC